MGDDEDIQGWEYLIHPLDPMSVLEGRDAADRLNELGRDGWELTGTVPVGGGPGGPSRTLLVFKRPEGRLSG